MQVVARTEIPKEKFDFVKNEVAKWEEGNILSRSQSDQILARYQPADGSQNGLFTLVYAGCAIVGIALFLFISANWKGIDVQTKCFVFILGMLSCYLYAWHLRGKTILRNVASEALVTMGCLLFGGAAVTVAQHFQITGTRPEVFLWVLGIAPIIWIFRSRHAAILAAIICTLKVPTIFEGVNFDPAAVLTMAVVVACAYWTRSQIALAIAISAAAFTCSMTSRSIDSATFILFGISCFVLHLGHHHSQRWRIFATPYLLLSMSIVLLGLFFTLLSRFGVTSENTDWIRIQISMAVALSSLACLAGTPAAKTYWPALTGVAMIGVVSLFAFLDGGKIEMPALLAGIFLIVNLFYLFYTTSVNENRFVQFLPIASLGMTSLLYIVSVPGGALVGSGVALAVGLAVLAFSTFALRRLHGNQLKCNLITTSHEVI